MNKDWKVYYYKGLFVFTWVVGELDCERWLPKWYAGAGVKYPCVMPENKCEN